MSNLRSNVGFAADLIQILTWLSGIAVAVLASWNGVQLRIPEGTIPELQLSTELVELSEPYKIVIFALLIVVTTSFVADLVRVVGTRFNRIPFQFELIFATLYAFGLSFFVLFVHELVFGAGISYVPVDFEPAIERIFSTIEGLRSGELNWQIIAFMSLWGLLGLMWVSAIEETGCGPLAGTILLGWLPVGLIFVLGISIFNVVVYSIAPVFLPNAKFAFLLIWPVGYSLARLGGRAWFIILLIIVLPMVMIVEGNSLPAA